MTAHKSDNVLVFIHSVMFQSLVQGAHLTCWALPSSEGTPEVWSKSSQSEMEV